MISRFRFLLLAISGAAVLSAGMPQATAQAVDPETHPASKVVKEYLSMILARQWNKSADIVDEASLAGLHKDYVDRIKGARTMDDEEALIRRVGKSTMDEVAKMKPRDFYTAYHEGLQERYKVDEAVLNIIRKTLTIRLLSAGQENERTVHILVRTKHSNGKAVIENLELVSLLKNGEKWQVALNEQAPKVTPVEGAGNAGAAKTVDPVKPATAPKPATPPKPATTKPAPGPKRR
jgi:hypothetical protein